MKLVKSFLFVVLLLCACSPSVTPEPIPQPEPVPTPDPDPVPIPDPDPETEIEKTSVERLLEEMTLREKIGQLFIIRPDGIDFSLSRDELEDINAEGVQSLNETLISTLKQYPVGGFVLFDKNINTPQQLNNLINELNNSLKFKPFIAIDEEGGTVSRLANNPHFELPQYLDMAYTENSDEAYEIGYTIGQYLKEYGFNLDFAPVADVNSNPNNPVIGTRAFSNDPEVVASMVTSIINGFHNSQIMTTLKHFPGHGDTNSDTHFESAITFKTFEKLNQLEFIPFTSGIEAGTDLVMMAHIKTPNLTDDDFPASLSPQIHDILRNNLNFKGLIITDSLSMKAISDNYSPEQVAIQIVHSKGDLILMPASLKQAFDALEQAFSSQQLNLEQLDETVSRILQIKIDYGIIQVEQ